MIITVFGGSEPSQEVYDVAYTLGKLIAKKGNVLKNGGTSGTMEAAAKGASEEGGKVIGVVVDGADSGSLAYHNEYMSEKISFTDYDLRVKELLNADHIVVLPGGIGTLEELFIAWVKSIVYTKKKLILLGEKNKRFLEYLRKEELVKEEYFDFIEYVDNIEDISFLK